MMTNSLLTPLQQAFLRAFFGDPVGQRFFLTGGTALAAFHLHHRLSDDLELETLRAFYSTVARKLMGDLNPKR